MQVLWGDKHKAQRCEELGRYKMGQQGTPCFTVVKHAQGMIATNLTK